MLLLYYLKITLIMDPDISSRISYLIPHDEKNCPLVARVQALQTQLSYYKAMCLAYETGKLKAQGNNRRLTIHKNYSKDFENFHLLVPETKHIQEFKQEQMKFSQQIDKKIRKGVKKNYEKQEGSFSKTPMFQASSIDFKQEQHSPFCLDEPMSKTISCREENKNLEVQAQNQIDYKNAEKVKQQYEMNNEEMPIQPLKEETAEQICIKINPPEPAQIQPKFGINLISDLCLFGCTQKQLRSLSNQKINETTPQLLFSMFDLNNKQYYDQVAQYLFPNGLYARTIRHQKILSEVNQILLQNIKKHSNFIYQLKSQLTMDQIQGEEKQLLQWVNPSLKLYCISILISDFTVIDPDPVLSDKQKSLEDEQKQEEDKVLQSNRSNEDVPNSKKRKQSQQLKNCQIYSNKKIISIFTYYPFFEFFESILISIFNALKVQKLGIYQNRIDTIFQIDSAYLIHQLENVYLPTINQINTTVMSPGLDYQFSLGVDLLKISTDGTKLIDACIGAWLYPVLRLFDKNTFYDILTAILFQQQVIFVCDNAHMLSYSIYLFTEILIRPFRYEHSAIYIVSYWDLLDAPTPIVLGINKPSQWLEETQLREGHLYVQIGEQATLVDKRKQHKKVKSEKLKKIITNFFKSIDRDNLTFFKQKKKKDAVEYNMVSTKNQKQISMLFISSINVFMKEELVDVIPSDKFMENVKIKFRWSNKMKNQDAATIISEEIIKQILRVRKQKDPFIQKFLRTQIFLTFLFDLVKLEE